MKISPTMTKKQAIFFENTFNYYKNTLFQGILPECYIEFSTKVGLYGIFFSNQWVDLKQKYIHEIILNPEILSLKSIEFHAIIVRNMVFLWLYMHGIHSRPNYLNKKAAQKLEEFGIIPSSTGAPGGKKIGQSILQYINYNGIFAKVFKKNPKKTSGYRHTSADDETNGKDKTLKIKFFCPSCMKKLPDLKEHKVLCLVCLGNSENKNLYDELMEKCQDFIFKEVR